MILQGHVKYQICYISTTTLPMATKGGEVVTNYEKISLTKLHNLLNMQSHEATW